MGGPNLEVAKFGLYLFVPVFALLHFGDPEWYRANVLPYQAKLFPAVENTNRVVPTESGELREALARIKAERRAKKAEREAGEGDAV
ncbi:hypothetical protein FIBSPDRAFT_826528 [Athelia psychrophila]|uniref:Uncharacterized protein n=1 Tax=Athelia psychrophila TaxID=1759441 RepID=A0A166JG03_9AGAM|nr:hypothetical protein FIBSPDRAFT_826528 [Fibularhizoctonia sp. CBS 109695]